MPPSHWHVCSSFSSCAATLFSFAGRVIGGVAAAAGAGVVATLVVAIVIVMRRRRQPEPVGASLPVTLIGPGRRAVHPGPAGQAVQVRISGRRPSRPDSDPASQRPGGRTWTVAAITDGGVPIGSSRGQSPNLNRRTPARGRQGRGASGYQLPLVPVPVGPGAAALDTQAASASDHDASGASAVTRSSGRRNLKAHRKHGGQKSLKRAAGTGTGTRAAGPAI